MNVKDILIIFQDSDKFFISQNYNYQLNQLSKKLIYYIQIYKVNL
jgi:hypothetical protein